MQNTFRPDQPQHVTEFTFIEATREVTTSFCQGLFYQLKDRIDFIAIKKR